MKLWFPLSVVALCVWMVGNLAVQAQAPAQPKEVLLKGKICCAKCELELSKKCASVIVVKENNKDVIYYFDTKANTKYHGDTCSDAKKGEVTGIVSVEDGKKIITVNTLKYEK